MTQPIQPGDLVMVVGSCCGKSDTIGAIRVVLEIDPLTETHCTICGNDVAAPIAHLDPRVGRGWVPVRFLKKIDPLKEPDTVERTEEVPA